MKAVSLFSTAIALSLLLGCGGPGDTPELGSVSGYVKLDGQPVPNATVTFQPQDGRPSKAVTNDEGFYELVYSRSEKGAKVGQHSVTVTTYVPPDDEGQGKVDERIPAKYNSKTELTKEVAAGKNSIDLELDSKGEIVEPSEGGGY